jgi:hypothetical protein
MTAVAVAEPPVIQLGPEWVAAEMPPGYQNRVEEIRRLVADLESMGQFGRLLWEVGTRLAAPTCEVFRSLKYDSQVRDDAGATAVVVKLDARRRLFLHVADAVDPLQKRSPELAHVFRLLHEVAGDDDRVALVTNSEGMKRPADRAEALAPDAAAFVSRMGVSHVSAATLFALWKLSLQEPDRARGQVDRLYSHEGGPWSLPTIR